VQADELSNSPEGLDQALERLNHIWVAWSDDGTVRIVSESHPSAAMTLSAFLQEVKKRQDAS
jgi:hypothetical protein